MITHELVRDMLIRCLNGQVSLAGLIDWAENALGEGKVAAQDAEAISLALARLGLGDVRAFSLIWEDAQAILASLGYWAYAEAIAA